LVFKDVSMISYKDNFEGKISWIIFMFLIRVVFNFMVSCSF